jgi:hypothetical protein
LKALLALQHQSIQMAGNVGSIIRKLAVAATVLISAPVIGLGVYDVVAVQPRLGQVRKILQDAPGQDANPPSLVRKMIDANSGSPSGDATSMVIGRIYAPQSTSPRWHMREALWRVLLPLHVGREGMYGLYATLAFNGTDHGLTAYASREFGKPLDQLSASQAAATVAVTYFPSAYSRDRERLNRRAEAILGRSGISP